MRGLEVWVPASELPALDDGEFYWFQLQGMEVHTEHANENVFLGKVDHLLDTGANDVLVVEPCDGSIDERQRLIPYLADDVVVEVDEDAGRVIVDWHPDD